MNFLRKFFTPKQSPLDTLKDLASTFAILNELEQRGAFHWHPRERILLIEETFARIQMAKGREGFHNFLNKVKDYQNYRLLQEAYNSHLIEEQTKAIREAKKKYVALSQSDITRIRQHVQDTLSELDASKITFSAYEIYIIRADVPSAEEALKSPSLEGRDGVGSGGALIAVGHYNSETENLEMSLYEDIKQNLFEQQ